MIKRRLRVYLLFAGFLFLAVVLAYLANFKKTSFSSDTLLWGGFGSYIGGTAGALLSFVSIVLLYETLTYQVHSNMTAQFESGFFELFKLHKEITNRIQGDVDIYIPGSATTEITKRAAGEKLFELLAIEFNKKFDASLTNIIASFDSPNDYKMRTSITRQTALDSINKEYDALFEGRESDLGHYFRSLFHLVKYVHSSKVSDKKKYVDLIQAFLTDGELYLIFYNGIGRYGREKFLPLLDDYSFFENIKSRGPIFEYHFELFYPKTYAKFIKKPKPDVL
jgi:hypothetical protein